MEGSGGAALNAPPKSETQDDDIYRVEEIKGHATRKGKVLYEVKWSGYDSAENTWEPESNINKADIEKYHKKRKMASEDTPTRASRNAKAIAKVMMEPLPKEMLSTPTRRTTATPKSKEKKKQVTSAKRESGRVKKKTSREATPTSSAKKKKRQATPASEAAKPKRKKTSSKGTPAKGKKASGEPEVYNVQCIRDTRLRNGIREFLVKWEGYSEKWNTWEPRSNFDECPKVLTEFWDAQDAAGKC